MSIALDDQVMNSMRDKGTNELLDIWRSNDRSQWSESAFSAVSQVLSERGVPAPHQVNVTSVFTEEDSRYVGVKGWLLWLCIALTIVGPLAYLAAAVLSLKVASDPSFGSRGSIFLFAGFMDAGLGAMSFWSGLSLWRVRPGAVKRAIIFFWAAIGYELFSNLFIFGSRLHLDLGQVIRSSPVSMLPGVIWLSYLESSKRVRATYGR